MPALALPLPGSSTLVLNSLHYICKLAWQDGAMQSLRTNFLFPHGLHFDVDTWVCGTKVCDSEKYVKDIVNWVFD